jgi:ABC-type polysaccharide/polyol phosphate export permease
MIYAVCFILVKQGMSGQSVATAEHWQDVLRTFMGVTLIQFWFQLLQELSDLVRQRRSLLRGMNISERPLMLAVIFESMFGLSIRVLTVILAVVFLGLTFPGDLAGWGWSLLSLCSLLVSATALGLLLAPWSALYPDVGKVIRSINLPVVLLSPVFYPATTLTDTALYWINCINPVAPALATLTDAMNGRPPFYALALITWTALGVFMALWSSSHLKRQIPILLERLGA